MRLFLNDDNYSRNLSHPWDLLSFLDGGQRIDHSGHVLPIRSTAICNGVSAGRFWKRRRVLRQSPTRYIYMGAVTMLHNLSLNSTILPCEEHELCCVHRIVSLILVTLKSSLCHLQLECEETEAQRGWGICTWPNSSGGTQGNKNWSSSKATLFLLGDSTLPVNPESLY